MVDILHAPLAPRVPAPLRPTGAPRQTNREWKTRAIPVLAGVVLAGAVAATAVAPPLRVTTLQVEGTDLVRLQAESLTRAFLEQHTVFAGEPRLFLVPRSQLAQHLTERIPQVATVQVLRRLPGILEVHLQEKVPVAFLLVSGHEYALDNAGTVIGEVSADEVLAQDLPRIRDLHTVTAVRPGQTVLDTLVLDILHQVVVKLPEHLAVSAKELLIPAIGSLEIQVRTSAGWLLLIDAQRPLEQQLRSFAQVVSEELQPEELLRLDYVDLRIPGKIYYRLRPPGSTRPPIP